MAGFRHLDDDAIEALIGALLSAGLDYRELRDQLFHGVNPHLLHSLKHYGSALDQLRADLRRLDGIERLGDGSVPLAQVLRNLEGALHVLPEAETVRGLRERVASGERAGGGAAARVAASTWVAVGIGGAALVALAVFLARGCEPAPADREAGVAEAGVRDAALAVEPDARGERDMKPADARVVRAGDGGAAEGAATDAATERGARRRRRRRDTVSQRRDAGRRLAPPVAIAKIGTLRPDGAALVVVTSSCRGLTVGQRVRGAKLIGRDGRRVARCDNTACLQTLGREDANIEFVRLELEGSGHVVCSR